MFTLLYAFMCVRVRVCVCMLVHIHSIVSVRDCVYVKLRAHLVATFKIYFGVNICVRRAKARAARNLKECMSN